MGLLIDTSVLIELERGRASPARLSSLGQSEDLFLSVVTASELLHGVHRANSPKRKEQREAFVEAVLHTLPLLPIDLEVARQHARLWAELRRTGRMIGAHDLLIAATAVAHGLFLLTHNLREFERIAELRVVSWNSIAVSAEE